MENIKAIILAGGMGTRLRPVTYTTPKPLCRVAGESVIERIIRLLKNSGIFDVVISTMYMAEAFEFITNEANDKFRIRLNKEITPLGSAGGVKSASKMLDINDDTDILILSGDGIFDFDIKDIIKFHKDNDADVTIVTFPSDEPSEYGVILTDDKGKIYSFSEKPSWSEVRSNTVNTGVYVIKSGILKLIPEDRAFDISKDLFPYVMGLNLKMFAYEATGYWCDVGSIQAYYNCNIDALSGKIRHCTDNNTKDVFQNFTRIEYPCYISDKAKISKTAKIGKYCIIEDNVTIGDNAEVYASIILHGSTLFDGAVVKNSIICENVCVGINALVMQGCVIGANSSVSKEAIVCEGIRIWPNKQIEKGFYVTQDVLFENKSKNIYADEGYNAGSIYESVDTEFITKLGCALGNALREEKEFKAKNSIPRIGVMHDGKAGCALIAETLLCSIRSVGVKGYSFLKGFEAQALFIASRFMCDILIYVTEVEDKRVIKIYDNKARVISHDFERKTESFLKVNKDERTAEVQDTVYIDSLNQFYYSDLLRYSDKISTSNDFTDIYVYSDGINNSPSSILTGIFKECGVTTLANPVEGSVIISVSDNGLDASVEQKLNDSVSIYFDTFHIKSALIVYRNILNSGELNKSELPTSEFMHKSDMVKAIVEFISILNNEKVSLAELMQSLPTFDIYIKELDTEDLGKENRAYVMKKLFENHINNTNLSNKDGINLIFDTGNVTVIPRRSGGFKIISEALSMESAMENSDFIEHEILSY